MNKYDKTNVEKLSNEIFHYQSPNKKIPSAK